MKKIFGFAFLLSTFYFLLAAPLALPTLAADGKCPAKSPGCTNLIVQIPGFLGQSVTNPVDYILGIYKFSLSVGGLLAMAIIVFAAIKRIASAGNPSAIGDANDMITNAIWGLALLFGAFLILNTINPKLTTISLETLNPVDVAADPHNVYANFDEVSRPYRDSLNNTIKSAQEKYDDAAKIAEDTEGMIADRQPDKSKWTPEQKARIEVAQWNKDAAYAVLLEDRAGLADLNYHSLRAEICGNYGVSCTNGFIKGAIPEEIAQLDKAAQARDTAAANARGVRDAVNADSTKIIHLQSQYNIQLQQQ